MRLIESEEKLYVNGKYIGTVKELIQRILNAGCNCPECRVEEANLIRSAETSLSDDD